MHLLYQTVSNYHLPLASFKLYWYYLLRYFFPHIVSQSCHPFTSIYPGRGPPALLQGHTNIPKPAEGLLRVLQNSNPGKCAECIPVGYTRTAPSGFFRCRGWAQPFFRGSSFLLLAAVVLFFQSLPRVHSCRWRQEHWLKSKSATALDSPSPPSLSMQTCRVSTTLHLPTAL